MVWGKKQRTQLLTFVNVKVVWNSLKRYVLSKEFNLLQFVPLNRFGTIAEVEY
mgnify:CR=1 FL=1